MKEKPIKEIRIKEVSILSDAGKREVYEKLRHLPDSFNFQGYAKVFYAEASPLQVVKVDPMEGDIIDELVKLGKELAQ